MSSIVIAGDTSGTVTLSAPSTAGTTTLTLPNTSGTIALTSNIPAGGQLQSAIFTAPGTWSIPSSCTTAKVTVIGAGGGGSGNNSNSTQNGGGAGGLNIQYFTGLTSGGTVSVTVGTGGSGGGPGSSGSPGGSSSFGPAGPVGTITSTGGAGGTAGGGGGAGGSGGNYGIGISGQGLPGLGPVAYGGSFLSSSTLNGVNGYFLYGHFGGNGVGLVGGGGKGAPYPGTGSAGGNGLVIVEFVG